jgi:2-dehydropantoate 2-reductase
VLDAAGIDYDLPVPVPYRLYRWFLLHGASLPLWVARRRNGLSDTAFPSMLADLEAGRPTEIDELNGVILRLGTEHGVPTAANRQLVRLVRAREADPAAGYLTRKQLSHTLDNV